MLVEDYGKEGKMTHIKFVSILRSQLSRVHYIRYQRHPGMKLENREIGFHVSWQGRIYVCVHVNNNNKPMMDGYFNELKAMKEDELLCFQAKPMYSWKGMYSHSTPLVYLISMRRDSYKGWNITKEGA
jgi:hypothetical protein